MRPRLLQLICVLHLWHHPCIPSIELLFLCQRNEYFRMVSSNRWRSLSLFLSMDYDKDNRQNTVPHSSPFQRSRQDVWWLDSRRNISTDIQVMLFDDLLSRHLSRLMHIDHPWNPTKPEFHSTMFHRSCLKISINYIWRRRTSSASNYKLLDQSKVPMVRNYRHWQLRRWDLLLARMPEIYWHCSMFVVWNVVRYPIECEDKLQVTTDGHMFE